MNGPLIRINWSKSHFRFPSLHYSTSALYRKRFLKTRRKEILVKAEEVFQSIFTAKSTYKRRVKESTGVLKQKNKCSVSALG